MSALNADDFVEIRHAGFDEAWRSVFTLAVVCDGTRTVVWDGHSHEEARAAARFWEAEGTLVVDLVVRETLQ